MRVFGYSGLGYSGLGFRSSDFGYEVVSTHRPLSSSFLWFVFRIR